MRGKKLKSVSLILFALLALNGCVTVPITKECSPAGSLLGGAFCSETAANGRNFELAMEEYMDFLQPQPDRECQPIGHFENGKWITDFSVCALRPLPDAPIEKLPARAGAYCRSAMDHEKQKTALEQLCREAGTRCTYEMRQALGLK